MSSKTQVFTLDQIKTATVDVDAIINSQREGFVAYTKGKTFVAPVIHLGTPTDPMKGGGDACLKCGFIKGDEYFVVKLASGSFSGNAKIGLSPNSGNMFVYSQVTGRLQAVLLDEGLLTELRTAAAGALAASLLGPRVVTNIGIVGTGIQARFQLEMLKNVVSCRDVIVYGRRESALKQFKIDMEQKGFKVRTTTSISDLCTSSNLIVCCTNARSSIIPASAIKPGTHITAIGADGGGKQELDPELVRICDLAVADSRIQCCEFGEFSHAIKKGFLQQDQVVEIGEVISERTFQRKSKKDKRITIFDSTGVAIQDVQIAKMVYTALNQRAHL